MTAISAFASLAHEGRLAVFRLLMRRAPGAVAAGELAQALGLRPSTLSNQLKDLEAAGLILSEREGRSILYRPNLETSGALLGYLAGDCCLGRPDLCSGLGLPLKPVEAEIRDGSDRMRALFVCTRNAARSIFAEAILSDLAPERFEALSAGAAPAGAVDPEALEVLVRHGHATEALRSRSWTEVAKETDGAPLELVVTVCDRAASEERPRWPGRPLASHWGVPDPAEASGPKAVRRAAYDTAYESLRRKIEHLVATPFEALSPAERQHALDEIALS